VTTVESDSCVTQALQTRKTSKVQIPHKPLVDYARTKPWLTYSGEGKYRPLGPAPRSTGE
jgi:hypothetical protein